MAGGVAFGEKERGAPIGVRPFMLFGSRGV